MGVVAGGERLYSRPCHSGVGGNSDSHTAQKEIWGLRTFNIMSCFWPFHYTMIQKTFSVCQGGVQLQGNHIEGVSRD